MSRYAYGYSVAPTRPTGWRSAFGNFIGVTAVVSLSVISGAVVSYELIGGDARCNRLQLRPYLFDRDPGLHLREA